MIIRSKQICALLVFLLPPVASLALVEGDLTRLLTVVPGEQTVQKITLSNDRDCPITVNIQQTDYQYDASGQNDFSEPGSHRRSNANWIDLHSRKVVLQPHECQDVFYRIRVPNDPKLDGTYWSLLLLEPDEAVTEIPSSDLNTPQFIVKIRYACQIVTTIGNPKPAVRLISKEIKELNGKRHLFIDVENNGISYIDLKLNAKIYGSSGSLTAQMDLQSQKILPDTSVRYFVDVSQLAPGPYVGFFMLSDSSGHAFGERYPFTLE